MRTKDTIKDVLSDLTVLATARFNEYLEDFERVNVSSQVWSIKDYGTIRLAIGRKAGQTLATVEFANQVFPGAYLYLAPNQSMAEHYEDCGAHNVRMWSDTSKINPDGLRAFFVDPGPHAGPKAKEEIYKLAAQALLSFPAGQEKPVIVYFVGT